MSDEKNLYPTSKALTGANAGRQSANNTTYEQSSHFMLMELSMQQPINCEIKNTRRCHKIHQRAPAPSDYRRALLSVDDEERQALVPR